VRLASLVFRSGYPDVLVEGVVPFFESLGQHPDGADKAAVQPGENTLGRALSRARRTEKPEDFARRHAKGDTAHGGCVGAGIGVRQALDSDHVSGWVVSSLDDSPPCCSRAPGPGWFNVGHGSCRLRGLRPLEKRAQAVASRGADVVLSQGSESVLFDDAPDDPGARSGKPWPSPTRRGSGMW
jgi:hypothetical protein